MILGEEDKPSLEDALEHHGVKGMKWGIRKEYSDRVRREAALTKKVAEGKGGLLDNLHVHGQTSSLELLSTKGSFDKAASNRADQLAGHADRVEKGKETVLDLMQYHGKVTMADLVVGSVRGLTTKK
jgi:hypothetical protein